MKKSLRRCPVCGAKLVVREYECPECHTVIRGRFEPTEFDTLEEEQLQFLRLFLRVRGNLSEVAKRLNISHPTARQKLNNLLKALGYEVEEEEKMTREEILNMVERGEISVEEAIKLLKGGIKNV